MFAAARAILLGSGAPNPFPDFGPLLGDWLADDAAFDGSNIVNTVVNSYAEGGAGDMISTGTPAPPPSGGNILYQPSGWVVDGSPGLLFQATSAGVAGCQLHAAVAPAEQYPAGNYTGFIVFNQSVVTTSDPIMSIGKVAENYDQWWNGYYNIMAYTGGFSSLGVGSPVPATQPQIFTVTRESANPTAPITLRRRLNKTNPSQVIFSGYPQYYGLYGINVAEIVLGGLGNGTSSTGVLKRALFYSALLTSENIDAAEQALADLYLPA